MDEQTTTKPAPTPAAVDKDPQDLSFEIERAVAREPQDRVRCVRVFNDRYRCNWWAPGIDDGPGGLRAEWARLATQRVRKSQFITARLSGGQLVIDDVPVNS